MNIYKISTLYVCGWFLLIGFCEPAQAQAPAASFEELRSSLKLTEGESIQVTSLDGKTVKGKVAAISDGAIAININGVRQEISESTVREIRHRKPDKWWNGALIGLGAGVAAGAIGVINTCGDDSECQFYASAVFFPTLAGIGAGAGAAIDFAIRKYETVYAASGTTTKRGISMSPILSKDKKGVRVAFSF